LAGIAASVREVVDTLVLMAVFCGLVQSGSNVEISK
jgi:hypothetical protein